MQVNLLQRAEITIANNGYDCFPVITHSVKPSVGQLPSNLLDLRFGDDNFIVLERVGGDLRA